MRFEGPNRRSRMRFPLELPVRYEVRSGGLQGGGTGTTVNIGSGGLLFQCDRELVPGTYVKLSISWPVRLTPKCGLRLTVAARVLRSRMNVVACEIKQYEFRTRAVMGAWPPAQAAATTGSIAAQTEAASGCSFAPM